MKPVGKMTQAELGAFVQSQLRKNGIEVVLAGGAAVAIYSNNKYVSRDLDLINIYGVNRRKIRAAMIAIGFHEERKYFRHPESQFFVEFPPGPLAIGEEPINEIVEKKLSTGILKIISPTDCVKDRLAAYYHWGDQQSLVQAILVAQRHKIRLDEVRRWSLAEGKLQEFERIKGKLTKYQVNKPHPCLPVSLSTCLLL
jgi:hypothetical protein